MRIVFDAASTKSARRIDENGFLHVTGCPITSFGIFDYARSEAQLPGDPNEIVKVLRAKEVISNETFLTSCQNLPLIDDHTYIEGITQDGDGLPDVDEGVDPDKKGVCGVMVNLRFDEETGWCVADLVVYSRTMIRLIMSGKKVELSLGFVCDFIPTEGGEVAAEQVDMRGNHLALVGKARVPGARVLDSAFSQQTSEEDQMKKKRIGDGAVDKLRELIPVLQQFLAEEAKEPEHQEGGEAEAGGEAETDEAKAAREAAEAAAAAGKSENQEEKAGDEETDGGTADDQVTALLKQLIAVLGGSTAATGDEETDASTDASTDGTNADVKAGDGNDNDEQIANSEKSTVTMDSMFQAVAERDALYSRVSKHTGAFDHASMTAGKVAEYAVKKLGIKCAVGDSAVALTAYMDGVEKATAKAVASVKQQRVGDSAAPSSSELDAYLNPQK
jgi:hypothetical protein